MLSPWHFVLCKSQTCARQKQLCRGQTLLVQLESDVMAVWGLGCSGGEEVQWGCLTKSGQLSTGSKLDLEPSHQELWRKVNRTSSWEGKGSCYDTPSWPHLPSCPCSRSSFPKRCVRSLPGG